MIRTAFARKTPLPRSAAPAVGKPRTKKCGNRACRAPYEVDVKRPWKNWCSDDCAVVIAIAKVDAQKAKKQRTERAQDKAKLERFKTRGQHIADTQVAFNALVRYRDRNEFCISCPVHLPTLANQPGGGFDCGHYRSRGSASHLRFDLRNAHGQCKKCNRYRAGNAADYRIGLIDRIGAAAVDALECDQAGGGWTIPELLAMKADFRAQLKQLKEAA